MMVGKDWLQLLSRAARNRFSGASRLHRCAILIDGDHVPPRLTGALLHLGSTLGRVHVVEVFANFAISANTGWAAQMRAHGLTGFQHYRTTPGKNAADAALIVRAMDLVHTARIDDYVLVSSDSDFSALAHRIRLSGAKVHGVGSASAATTLRQSCSSFLTFAEVSDFANLENEQAAPELWSRPPREAEDRLLHAIISLGGARQWVNVPELGEHLRRSSPLFDPRAYSRRTLTDLCDAIDSIDVDRSESQPRVRIAFGTGTS